MRAPLALLIAAMAWQAVAASASAFVRETVEGDPDTPLFWRSREVTVETAEDSSADVPASALVPAVAVSLQQWGDADEGCSDMMLVVGPPASVTTTNLDGGARDGRNRIVWRETEWLLDPDVLAITTLVYSASTGEILDADIDVNGVDHYWSARDTDVTNDVQNTITHELGHLIGFAHTPDTEATMYGRSDPGETKKRDLDGDDIAALCTVYPTGAPTPGSLGVSRGMLRAETSCAVRGPPVVDRGPAWVVALALLLAAWRRRRHVRVGLTSRFTREQLVYTCAVRNLSALAFLLALVGGGCDTPTSICEDFVGALNGMWERCGHATRVQLFRDDGRPADCDDVNEVRDANPLVCECIPWAEERSCEDVDANPTMLDPTCQGQHFYYIAD